MVNKKRDNEKPPARYSLTSEMYQLKPVKPKVSNTFVKIPSTTGISGVNPIKKDNIRTPLFRNLDKKLSGLQNNSTINENIADV